MPVCSPIDPAVLPPHPLAIADRWPEDQALLVLHSGAAAARRWSRWSILAAPSGWFVHDGRSRATGSVAALDVEFGDDPVEDLDRLLAATASSSSPPDAVPFSSGWIGYLSYDLGREIEPKAAHEPGSMDTRGWPLLAFARCDRGLVFDHQTGTWFTMGDFDPVRDLRPSASAGRSPTAMEGGFSTTLEPEAYLQTVAKTIRYIGAGDIFQANITQRITTTIRGHLRAFAMLALETSEAWYGAHLELPGNRAVISMSPELFLEVDGTTREVTTRPIKGTRPGDISPEELRVSKKDEAELTMIVDLMRNDLGRVCRFGSVVVPTARTIESHPTVHHGVGEVRGILRDGITFGDLLRATFPGGSVTGAPKIRAMQIIDELEPVRRGPYCGAIGIVSDDGDARFNIAIRTMCLSAITSLGDGRVEGRLDYGVGGGIVADSEPQAEHRESLDKARVLELVLGARACS